MMSEEADRRMDPDAPERDLSSYTAWRDTADPDNLNLIGIYSPMLVNQCAGMTDALDLRAVVLALDLFGIDDPQERLELAERLPILHGMVRERNRPKTEDVH